MDKQMHLKLKVPKSTICTQIHILGPIVRQFVPREKLLKIIYIPQLTYRALVGAIPSNEWEYVVSRNFCVWEEPRENTFLTSPEQWSCLAATVPALRVGTCTKIVLKPGKRLFSTFWPALERHRRKWEIGPRSKRFSICGNRDTASCQPTAAVGVGRETWGKTLTGSHLDHPLQEIQVGKIIIRVSERITLIYVCLTFPGPNSDSEKQKRRRKKGGKGSKPALTIGLPTFVNGLQARELK